VSARLEIAATSVVLSGSFNPPILQPWWFEAHELLGPEHARAAEARLKAIDTELIGFDVEWLEMQATRDACTFVTNDSARHADLRDLVIGTFTLLPNTPLLAVGLNRLVHYQLSAADEYEKIVDDYLTTKEAWAFLENPAPRAVRMTSRRPHDEPKPGFTLVEVAPSVRVKPLGLFIAVNEHYQWAAEGEMMPSEDLPAVLAAEWEPARMRANEIALHILRT
jgi:hypothetical protein